MKDKMIDAWEEEARRWTEMDEEFEEEEYEYPDRNTEFNYYIISSLEIGMDFEEATDPCEFCGVCDGYCWYNINYDGVSWALAKYCSKHFDKWFDKDMFNYGENFLEILKGWDRKRIKEKFENGSYCLAKYCSEHFDKWYDAEKFDWGNKEAVRALVEYCFDHSEKWARDFVDRVDDFELVQMLQLQKIQRTTKKILI